MPQRDGRRIEHQRRRPAEDPHPDPRLTMGYQVNDNMTLSFTYKSTINDSETTAMRMDMFMITLIAGWHPTLEGANRAAEQVSWEILPGTGRHF